ncbi:MAG: HAD family phosphatase [Acidobacteria bacterium]|nr:HAD family phosphatase [Acidobacteriota bacterium]MDW7985425.1 HAD family phosphatase [Acidobacteriota bacterium]
MQGTRIRAIVLDFDGVVVDSEPIFFECMRETLRGVGIEITPDEYFSRYVALHDQDAMTCILASRGIDLPEAEVVRLLEDKRRRYRERMSRGPIPWVAGFAPWVRTAQARGIRLAIASSSSQEAIGTVLPHCPVSVSWVAIVTPAPGLRGKPAPDLYLEALARLRGPTPDLRPEQVLAIEDTPDGIRAAHQAGLRVAALTTTLPASALQAADWVIGPDWTAFPWDLCGFWEA